MSSPPPKIFSQGTCTKSEQRQDLRIVGRPTNDRFRKRFTLARHRTGSTVGRLMIGSERKEAVFED